MAAASSKVFPQTRTQTQLNKNKLNHTMDFIPLFIHFPTIPHVTTLNCFNMTQYETSFIHFPLLKKYFSSSSASIIFLSFLFGFPKTSFLPTF